MSGLCLPQPQVLYQRPESLNLRRILTVPSNAVFGTECSDVIPGSFWSHFPSLGVIALSAPTITGITLAFIFHIIY